MRAACVSSRRRKRSQTVLRRTGCTASGAIFVDSAPRDFTPEKRGEVPDVVKAHFDSAVEDDPILIEERGRVLRKFHVFTCRGYREAGH